MQNACILPKYNQFQSALQWFHIKQFLGYVYTKNKSAVYLSVYSVRSKCKVEGLRSMTITWIFYLRVYLNLSHLIAHVVNRLLRENRKSIPNFLSGIKLLKNVTLQILNFSR